ncbi:MAG TPA: lipase family protein [Acidimicrobiales bacterium]|nr:lipase family protein [Acidimicrobiales bacterium]
MAPGVLVSAVMFSPGARAATSSVPPPTSDPFYAAPSNLASVPPGTVLRSRTVIVSVDPGTAVTTAVSATAEQYPAYQLLYRTNGASGQPVANVTTLIVGAGTQPVGGRELVSLQDAEDSVDPDCAPSYQLQVGENAPNGDSNSTLAEEMQSMVPWLEQGYDVVVPDPEGPDSEFMVSAMAAHAVLDSIRAVEQFAPAELGGATTPVGLWGYSGGAFETTAANEQQPAYAPDVHLVAAAAGGVPVGGEETIQWLDGSTEAGIMMVAAIGIDRAYPQMGLYSFLNAAGLAFAQTASTGCATFGGGAAFTRFDSWTTVPNAWQLPQVQQVLTANELGQAVPKTPAFYYNAIRDELVWVQPLDQLVAADCAGGAPINYYRDPTALEHTEGGVTFGVVSEAFLAARFAGTPVPDSCGQPGNAVAGTGLVPAPTVNWGWGPNLLSGSTGG